ncbi:MAG: cobalamin-binding protein [Methanoregula sp.]|nr:cobalamin-binding protein [Methanoregula sp.]
MKSVSYLQKRNALILLVAILVPACCALPVSAVTITDDAGTEISLNATPARIVSLAPSNTELLGALALLDRVAGVTTVCNYPPEAASITRIGGYSTVSVEKVAAVRPDLVIASDITPKETVDRLREIGLTVMVIAPKNIDHMVRDIHKVGSMTGTESQSDLLAVNLTSRLAVVASAIPASQRPTVAHVVWNDPLYVSGNNTLQDDVIAHAGGKNAFAGVERWGTVSLEEFLMKNPDIIIVNGGDGMDNETKDVILEDFMTRPQYASLSAVKNHHVYAMNADVISRAGPRIVDATEQVAGIIRSVNDERSASQPGTALASTVKTPGFTVLVALAGLVACSILTGKR